MRLFQATEALLAAFKRQPEIDALAFAGLSAYGQFIEAAERDGFTGPDIEMDPEFAERTPGWVAQADEQQLPQWLHTLIRSDRSNGDYPTAVLMACRSGAMDALVTRLAG